MHPAVGLSLDSAQHSDTARSILARRRVTWTHPDGGRETREGDSEGVALLRATLLGRHRIPNYVVSARAHVYLLACGLTAEDL